MEINPREIQIKKKRMAKNGKVEEMIKETSRNKDELNIELRMMKAE